MRFNLKTLFIGALMSTMFAFPVVAAESATPVFSANAEQEESVLLPIGAESSKDVVSAIERSSIVSTASSEIIDETGGNIGVIIETLCHVECDKIRNIAILDRYNEENNKWVEVARYDFTAVKEDFPTQSLTSLTNAFTVENQQTGYYYRVRGIHNVWSGDDAQVYSTRTDGLLITEYGR